jgi:uncharacterized protein YjaZ
MCSFIKQLKQVALGMHLLAGWAWSQEEMAFQIVPAYEGQRAYLDILNANPALIFEENVERYKQLVLAPYAEQCAAGSEEDFVESNFYYETTKLSAWLQVVEQVETSATDINDAIKRVMSKISPILPAEVITFCIFALHPNEEFAIQRMGGVTGATASANVIYLQVYPTEGWLEKLEYTVAHEYHHAALAQRLPNNSDKLDLTNYLIFEGKADSFAKLVYPDVIVPWTEALEPDQERALWQTIQPLLTTENVYLHQDIMFGSARFPTWTGYTIGFNIVQAFLKHYPDIDVEVWTEMDAQTLLEQSGYQP